jgi:hypothetical protein
VGARQASQGEQKVSVLEISAEKLVEAVEAAAAGGDAGAEVVLALLIGFR